MRLIAAQARRADTLSDAIKLTVVKDGETSKFTSIRQLLYSHSALSNYPSSPRN